MAYKKTSPSNLAKASGSSAVCNGNSGGQDDIVVAKEQKKMIQDAKNTTWKHAYFKPDLNDPQIIGGTKETALISYNPGIIISEQGRTTDRKLDQHDEWEFGGPWGVTAMMILFPLLMYYFWICAFLSLPALSLS